MISIKVLQKGDNLKNMLQKLQEYITILKVVYPFSVCGKEVLL